MGSANRNPQTERIIAMKMVAIRPISPFEPIYLRRSETSAPDRYRIMAVFVIPNLNISMKVPEETKSTYWPNCSVGKLLASRAKPANPKADIERFPARERKLSSFIIFFTVPFKSFWVKFDFVKAGKQRSRELNPMSTMIGKVVPSKRNYNRKNNKKYFQED